VKVPDARGRVRSIASRKGGWAVAQSPMMRTTVTLDRLIRIGYQSFSNTYLSVSPVLANRLIPNGM